MQVTVKLMGMYRDRTPPQGKLELAEAACLRDLLSVLEIPDAHVQMVSVNNQFEKNLERRLAAGDDVTILPTVTGG